MAHFFCLTSGLRDLKPLNTVIYASLCWSSGEFDFDADKLMNVAGHGLMRSSV